MSKNNIEKMVVYFIGAFSFLIVLFYIIYLSLNYYHSDCVDSILWAEAALEGNGLINPDFHYAAIMPLGGELFFMPFVAIFGFTTKAQIMGIVLFYFCFVASILFLCYAMKLNIKWSICIMSFVILLVSISEKLREIFWGHIIYYSLGLLFLFFGLGLIFLFLDEWERNNKKENKKLIFIGIILFVWNTICASNGMQLLAMYTVPVTVALLAVCFFDFEKKLLNASNIGKFSIILLLLASTSIGNTLGKFLSQDVESGYQKAYSSFSDYTEWGNNLNMLFPKIFMLLGVDTSVGTTLFSLDGIINLIKIGFGIMIFVVPIIMLFYYKKIDEKQKILLITHHILTLIILAGWVFGKLSAANWRMSPPLVTGAVLNILFIKMIMKQKLYIRVGVLFSTILAIIMIVSSIGLFKLNGSSPKVNEIKELISMLEANNLEYGYATFWNAGVTTLLSDSKVKVRNVEIDENGIQKYNYQTNKKWYEDVTGYDKYFVVMTNEEYLMYSKNIDEFEKADEIHETLHYIVLVYDHNIFRTQ